jgi:catechol 2,3-dioxygenase-like lactoylglutathione lyase family enzyme
MTELPPERVTGIGGVFFKSKDPDALRRWYREHLGIAFEPGDGATFLWRDDQRGAGSEVTGSTTWSVFDEGSDYFDPSSARFMINYRVADLDRMRSQLRAAGVEVDDRVEAMEYGRFGWARDPEGNRFELWEPAPGL